MVVAFVPQLFGFQPCGKVGLEELAVSTEGLAIKLELSAEIMAAGGKSIRHHAKIAAHNARFIFFKTLNNFIRILFEFNSTICLTHKQI